MKIAALTLRVDSLEEYNERRDAIDQRWYKFLSACNLHPFLVPNCDTFGLKLITKINPDLIILTGGNSLEKYGGDAIERDTLEVYILEFAIRNNIPLLGVCRGMQLIQNYFGTSLFKVFNHISTEHEIIFKGEKTTINSFHQYGTDELTDSFNMISSTEDNIIKAIQHKNLPIVGIMWHPERERNFKARDIELVKNLCES